MTTKTDEMAAVWLTLGSLAKDIKELRRDYKRLLSALRRHEPGPMYEFDLPKNGGSNAASPLMGYAERDDLRGVCRCGANGEEHPCPAVPS